ncbi:MAG TPA: hypothetical protein VLH60_02940 [Sedimentisphaerales bacterium]|nr:hypothetical protein [Sedimentisphaerales bacterium]
MLAENITVLLAVWAPAVTVLERMQGLRRTDSSFSLAHPGLFTAGIIAITGLAILLYFVHKRTVQRRREKAAAAPESKADRYGLTAAEHRLTMAIARLSDISDVDLIFSSKGAFCRGAAKLLQRRDVTGEGAEDRRQIREAIDLISRKLGFAGSAEGTPGAALGPSSRQIPVGRKVTVLTGCNGAATQTEATVTENSDEGLTLHPKDGSGVGVAVGEMLRIQYNFGTSAWEFASAVIDSAEDRIRVAHTDLARFANRRRFLRVPAQDTAMVARCGFELECENVGEALPQFVAAEVTEIAGPGMRIQTALDITAGERVLIVIRFENGRIIRDIAEVKHVQPMVAGYSAALELVTLSDKEVSVLVRLTNQAAKKLEAAVRTEAETEAAVSERQ